MEEQPGETWDSAWKLSLSFGVHGHGGGNAQTSLTALLHSLANGRSMSAGMRQWPKMS